MTDEVRDSYDTMSGLYTAVNLNGFDRATFDLNWLSEFAELALSSEGPVADLGCGPGHVSNHLSGLGLATVGYDISPNLIAEARSRFPALEFHLADITAIDVAGSSFGGILARYSLIHMLPTLLESVFDGWLPIVEPGGPVLVSFFASGSAEAHGTPFDHAVVTAYELFPATIAKHLQDAGFTIVEIDTRSPREGERPLDHSVILAMRPNI